jgi:hypothetical protein
MTELDQTQDNMLGHRTIITCHFTRSSLHRFVSSRTCNDGGRATPVSSALVACSIPTSNCNYGDLWGWWAPPMSHLFFVSPIKCQQVAKTMDHVTGIMVGFFGVLIHDMRCTYYSPDNFRFLVRSQDPGYFKKHSTSVKKSRTCIHALRLWLPPSADENTGHSNYLMWWKIN